MNDFWTYGMHPDFDDIHALRKQWNWFLTLGIGMVLVGALAVGFAFFATVVSVIFFGLILLAAGVSQTITSFWSPRWGGVMLHLLFGILYTVVGFLMIDQPLISAEALTVLLAAFFIAGGTIRIVMSLQMRFRNWGWQLLNGVINLLLGVLIWTQLPTAALWIIGLFVGIDLIFNGWAWTMFAWEARNLPEAATESTTTGTVTHTTGKTTTPAYEHQPTGTHTNV